MNNILPDIDRSRFLGSDILSFAGLWLNGKLLDGTSGSGVNYSLDEKPLGIKWTEGSDIYFKTLHTGALPNATTKQVAHNIINLGIFIKFEGWALSVLAAENLKYISLNSSNIALAGGITNLSLTTSTNMSSYTMSYVTMYYIHA